MPKKRITSRLANKQKKELTKQSIVLILLSLLITIIFLLVVLPSAVRLFFEILDDQTVIEQDAGLPPQPPIVASPPEHTNQESLTLRGFTQAEVTVVMLINHQEVETVQADENGEFELELDLNPGNNLVTLYSVNDREVESAQTNFQINLDTTSPEIKIGAPEEGERFELRENQTIQIQGETKPRARVFIDGRVTMADAEGNFSQRYHLEEGENKIEIRVIDQAGNEAETELTVFFRM